MADTTHRGPINAPGPLLIQSGTAATIEPLDGPSMFYQGVGMFDMRAQYNGVFTRPGQNTGFLNSNDFLSLDHIPQAAGTAVLAAGQIATNGLAMTLATVAVTNFSAGAASIAVGVPLIPAGTTVAQNVIALDFGFTTGTTIANSSTVAVPDTSLFTVGQWIIIGNVGNAAGTLSLSTQIQSTNGTAQIFVSPQPATALGAPIGQSNLFGATLLPPATPFGPGVVTPTSHSKNISSGATKVHNPRELLARNISVSVVTAAVQTASVLVSGYDVWAQPMTELITVNASSGVTTGWGKKAFKYIVSAVSQTNVSTAGALLLGIGDTFGLPFRADENQLLTVWAGNTTVPNSVGWLAAVTTGATNTSGDVRGTFQLSGNGNGTPITSVATTDNVKRLVVIQTIGVWNTVLSTPNNLTPMFGTTQV